MYKHLRYHVFRKRLFHKRRQLYSVNRLFRYIVAAKELVAVPALDKHNAALYAFIPVHDVFYFIQLDSQTSELDLIIASAAVNNFSVTVPVRNITAPVCSFAAKLDELLLCHLIKTDIASADAAADNRQLAARIFGQDIVIAVKHVYLCIACRGAYCHITAVKGINRYCDCGFSRAVAVKDNPLKARSAHLVIQCFGERLCPDYNRPQLT